MKQPQRETSYKFEKCNRQPSGHIQFGWARARGTQLSWGERGKGFSFNMGRVDANFPSPAKQRGNLYYPLFLTHPTNILRDVKMKLSNMQAVGRVWTGTRIQWGCVLEWTYQISKLAFPFPFPSLVSENLSFTTQFSRGQSAVSKGKMIRGKGRLVYRPGAAQSAQGLRTAYRVSPRELCVGTGDLRMPFLRGICNYCNLQENDWGGLTSPPFLEILVDPSISCFIWEETWFMDPAWFQNVA